MIFFSAPSSFVARLKECPKFPKVHPLCFFYYNYLKKKLFALKTPRVRHLLGGPGAAGNYPVECKEGSESPAKMQRKQNEILKPEWGYPGGFGK